MLPCVGGISAATPSPLLTNNEYNKVVYSLGDFVVVNNCTLSFHKQNVSDRKCIFPLEYFK